MSAMILFIIFAALFFILGIIFFFGKGAWLIAGYNTASPEERAKYDEKKLTRAVGFLCTSIAILFMVLYFGITTNFLFFLPALFLTGVMTVTSLRMIFGKYVLAG